MENNEEQIPLEEVIYKPTTQSDVLKPDKVATTSWFLFFAASVANLLGFTGGIAIGWPSPVLPKLVSKDLSDNPLGRTITGSEEAWIAGLPCLASMVGPFVVGYLGEKIGRKKTILLIAFPMVISLLIAAYAKTVMLLYISRFMIGFGLGSALAILPIYLSEISEDHNRGTIGCFVGMFFSFGLLFTFAVGPFLTIRNFCLLCAVPPIIFIPVFLIWIPESPQYLASINKNKELEISLTKLRDKSPTEIQKEIVSITQSVFEQSETKAGIKDFVDTKSLRNGLIVTVGIMTLQQFAGINAVLSYMQSIFQAAGSGFAPEISAIIIGVIQTVITVTTSSLVERLGRRPLLLSSASGCCISLIALGIYFYLKTHDFKTDTISWLPVSSLIAYIVFFNIGLGPLPWAIMGEMFPSNVKTIACSFSTVVCFTAAFIITYFFPVLSKMVGMAVSFWVFSVICFLGTIFVYLVLPETKGRSIQEIQRLLEGRT